MIKKDKLRKKVFESAWQIVASKGIEHLNARSLARESLCALGSIYNAFGSFDDLQLHINAKTLTLLYQLLNEITVRGINEDKSLRALFRDLGHAYIDFGLKNLSLWKALFEYFPNESIPEWYRKHAREGIYQICKQISEAYQISETESKHLVGFFWASIHGVSAILLNRKMEMVAELFNTDNLHPYVEYCLNGLFKEMSNV